MSALGNPKCVCEECEALIDSATKSHDPEEITEACHTLGQRLTDGNTGDEQIIVSVGEIIQNASQRCNAIKEGTYDFALDEENPDEEFDITEDLEETEEDRAKDAHDEKVMKILDTISSWAAGLILVGAVTFFIFKFML